MSSEEETKTRDANRDEKRERRSDVHKSGNSSGREDPESWRMRASRDEDSRTQKRDVRPQRRGNDGRRRSRSPRLSADDRRDFDSRRRNNAESFAPKRPKLFQRPDANPSTSAEATKSWSTRIAAVTTDDSQRNKFEKLLGIHKKDANTAGAGVVAPKAEVKPTAVAENEIRDMRQQLDKMQNDLDSQYTQGRAFTHAFRGRGL